MFKRKFLSVIITIALVAGFSSCKDDKEEDILDNGSNTTSTIQGLFINEVVINTDWIELYNSSDATIDLSGFVLQDDRQGTEEYVIPNGKSIPAKGFLVFDGEEVDFVFGLSSDGDAVILLDAGRNQIDRVDVPAEKDGNAYARTTDGGSEWTKQTPTKGTSNSGATAPTADLSNLRINEVNGIGAGGDATKYVELYNTGNIDINLEGVTLIYNGDETWKGQAADVVPAKGYKVILGSKSSYPSMIKGLSANNADVILEMVAPDGTTVLDTYSKLVDINSGYDLIKNTAHQRIPDGTGTWYYTNTTGTQGTANSTMANGFFAFGQEANAANGAIPIDYSVLVINEVDGNGKFVEIYNTGAESISLAGITLVKNESQTWWTGGDINIPAGGYYSISEEGTMAGTGIGASGISPKKNVKFELKNGIYIIDFFVRSTAIALDDSCTPDYGKGTPYSFGRVPNATGDFKLTLPSCNAANGASQGEIVTE
jgi:hypothetical protein